MIEFLTKILEVDSTSGKENYLIHYIKEHLSPEGAKCEIQETVNGRLNLFYTWGEPEIIFCSHIDTVPPYIPPVISDKIIYGRGSCDAKGQVAIMYEVCKQLHKEGEYNFGLLILAGEEDGSHGAKRANELIKGNEFVIIGEPTRNKLIEASKGTLLAKINFKGKACHSGYQQYGDSAVERMIKFVNRLSHIRFEYDKVLGSTTYNYSHLNSDNANNVVPDDVSLNIYFRTTWKSNRMIKEVLWGLADELTDISFGSNDEPLRYYTLPGFETDIVAYGTDAPSLFKLGKPLLYGPGSILTAHTEHEHIHIDDLHKGITDLKKIYTLLKEKVSEKKTSIITKENYYSTRVA